jgi:CheY-like chemotaxis protein
MSKQSHVLVADDDEQDVFLLRRAFTKAGLKHEIVDVHDGEEAIKYLVGNTGLNPEAHGLPSLLVLDIKMPKADGFDVLHWLRRQPELKKMPVVMLSSSSQDCDREKARRLGANDYFVKATQFEELQKVAETIASRWLKNP